MYDVAPMQVGAKPLAGSGDAGRQTIGLHELCREDGTDGMDACCRQL